MAVTTKPPKNILHITPHFAPGQCGVSDYTLCWKNCLSNDSGVFIAALRDRYNTGILNEQGLLRIGAEQSNVLRLKLFSKVLQSEHFEAVVIHYVPQGYGHHGLPLWLFQISRMLRKADLPITIIAHELWSGGIGKPLKVRIKGWLQKNFLLVWLHSMGRLPKIITTSAFTSTQLNSAGIAASWSPVFSNLGDTANSNGLPDRVISAFAERKDIHVLLFGSIPPDAHPGETADFLSVLHAYYGMPISVWHVGHGATEPFLPVLSFFEMGDVRFEAIGPMPAPAINWLMQQVQWGLSTYPIELWSKSGSIAAMLANGLPVAVTGRLPDGVFAGYSKYPPKLLPWSLLSSVEQKEMAAAFSVLPVVPLPSYNHTISSRLHGLSGLGSIQPTIFEKPSLSVVITVFRCWPKALKCLEHLFATDCTGLIVEVLVINDDPAGEVPEVVYSYPLVRVFTNDKNIGYVGSVNRGMAIASSQFVILLDADAYLQDSLLPAVLLMVNDPATHLVLPASLMSDGTPVRRLYPRPHVFSLLMGQGFEGWWWRVNRSPQVIAHSYAWLLRRDEFLALESLDEKLNFVEADVDFCMRLQQKYPASVLICEAVKVEHEGGANPIRRNNRVVEWYRSRWYILSKHDQLQNIGIIKHCISLRLTLERGVASVMAIFGGKEKAYWTQKAEGRALLLRDLKNW